MNCLVESTVLLNLFYVVMSIEPPSSRTRHFLRVSVQPKFSVMGADESVLVQCLVDSSARQDHFPRIGLYLQLEENTVIPISSDVPGITVKTVAAAGTNTKFGRHSKSMTYVTIGPEMYQILSIGENNFICAASTVAEYQQDFFAIWKV